MLWLNSFSEASWGLWLHLLCLHSKEVEKRLGAVQSYVNHIKPSIGVGFKILVEAPLFFRLDGQTKGGVVVGTIGSFFVNLVHLG